jgi:hypothetical protein
LIRASIRSWQRHRQRQIPVATVSPFLFVVNLAAANVVLVSPNGDQTFESFEILRV